ncbi:IS3 family transposase [Bradyrhizobium sp. CB3481]|uniref:IS3 family transposase n=1 Tax=Bradyrhizobium sp. CB3481 TaxID=3039158 RepID=UPI0024B153D6|nr:IS3 family transposase [Bradyrhizobium sp. CB3481]WFU14341.1 IS3 family transposase [Bradyrhizobium sp. CB3481]
MRVRFIEDRRADYPVRIMCDVLGVSPAGYYAWRARLESPRAAANRELVDDIKRAHRDTNGRYGSPRVYAELRAQGRGASRGRIERLMRYEADSSGRRNTLELEVAMRIRKRRSARSGQRRYHRQDDHLWLDGMNREVSGELLLPGKAAKKLRWKPGCHSL